MRAMRARTAKRLFDFSVDEISSVDRDANGHARVVIAKADTEEPGDMPIFDAEGSEVDPQDLEFGDFVYDDDGNEYQFVDEETAAALEAEGYDDGGDGYDAENSADDYELVGKALPGRGAARAAGRAVSGAAKTTRRGAATGSHAVTDLFKPVGRYNAKAGFLRGLRGQPTSAKSGTYTRAYAVGRGARKVRQIPGEHPYYTAGGALLAGAGGGAAVNNQFQKSLGDQVLERINKALNDDERNEAIADAMDYIESIAKRNEETEEQLGELQAQLEFGEYVEIAKSYGLPMDDEELAEILYDAANSMDPEAVSKLDRLLAAAGEQAFYSELGANGAEGHSDVMAALEALATEGVAKSDGAYTNEQAIVALLEANPDAYDAWEAEERLYHRGG